jgi:hypothetical protein
MYLDDLPATNFSGKKLDPTVFEKVHRLLLKLLRHMVFDTVYVVFAADVCRTARSAV